VDVKLIETSRAPERPNGIQVDRLRVQVARSKDFSALFVDQMVEKKRKKVASAAALADAGAGRGDDDG
jgi:hypothetical protein